MPIQLKTALPGPKSLALMAERELHVARGPFHTTPLFVTRAHGALLEDVDGNTLVDFASGIGVVNVGHVAPKVTEAIRAQAGRLIHAGFNVTPYESYIRVAQLLNLKTPGRYPKKSFLVNSGSEAVENAVKIARAYTKRQAVVCFDHAFHGRTYMAMSLTSKAQPYKEGFGPFMPEVHRAAYPNVYRWPTGSDPAQVSSECFHQLEELVIKRIGVSEVAAVVIEPLLGEGGFLCAPPAFLARLREFCTRHGIVLIADEVQTGFGRTGSLFACEQLGLVPDLIASAKGLAAGLPLGAVTGRAEMMDAPGPGGIGGTFGGNPVACAAALEVFALFEDGTLFAKAKALGELLMKRMRALAEKYPVIGEVRGLGCMVAVELVKDRSTREPDPDAVEKVLRGCYERGVVVMKAGPYNNSVRFLMPLVIENEDLEQGLRAVEDAFAAL
jgi:4-aminobutyrate aminotransferase / (S)-3-amino-2-methylpropionate transaminase / 5-aminovalerate transaminase